MLGILGLGAIFVQMNEVMIIYNSATTFFNLLSKYSPIPLKTYGLPSSILLVKIVFS
jgi:hypothetical protein